MQEVALSTMKTFDKEAAILAGMGVTIVIASGDNGVANVNCACDSNSGRTATGTDWAVRPSLIFVLLIFLCKF